ncbi:MAG: hypothetical protein HY721_01270 [Planctomycetes bacterium]|nr:hypothetical protein [Planctomycetota bacterium]
MLRQLVVRGLQALALGACLWLALWALRSGSAGGGGPAQSPRPPAGGDLHGDGPIRPTDAAHLLGWLLLDEDAKAT